MRVIMRVVVLFVMSGGWQGGVSRWRLGGPPVVRRLCYSVSLPAGTAPGVGATPGRGHPAALAERASRPSLVS